MRLAFIMMVMLFVNGLGHSYPDKAPPPFGRKGEVVPIDIKTVVIDYKFDYDQREAQASAKMVYDQEADGKPFFDLIPEVNKLMIDGIAVPVALFKSIRDPDGVATFRIIDKTLKAGTHEIILEYNIDSEVTFSSNAVRTGFFMSDLTSRRFFEQYGPTNMEYDQIQYRFNVEVEGVTKAHRIFTNGQVQATSDFTWTVKFPDYFTASSIYFHLSDESRYRIEEFEYEGLQATIPVTVYARSSYLASQGTTKTKKYMELLEDKFGPYAHEKLVVYVAGSGGMEYGGATMTSISALNHELTHFWFARGVMPANGNAGWVDEAIASWQDDGFRPGSQAPDRSAVNLGGFSPYRRYTTRAAYSQGEQLIRELDYVLRDNGGMIPLLRSFYEKYQRKTFLVEDFKAHLERETQVNMDGIFDRYVYGNANLEDRVEEEPTHPDQLDGHPRAYTKEELIFYR